jgi:hypothetical protein
VAANSAAMAHILLIRCRTAQRCPQYSIASLEVRWLLPSQETVLARYRVAT